MGMIEVNAIHPDGHVWNPKVFNLGLHEPQKFPQAVYAQHLLALNQYPRAQNRLSSLECGMMWNSSTTVPFMCPDSEHCNSSSQLHRKLYASCHWARMKKTENVALSFLLTLRREEIPLA